MYVFTIFSPFTFLSSHAESLALFNTGISGGIPDLSNLQKLEVFKVENCALTGDGFMSLYNVPPLKVLGVAGNPIAGSLEGVGKLLALEELYIGQTSISGTLPQAMGNFHQLKYIKSSETSLTGAIPTSLGNLKNLIEMDFSINQFTGVLPTEFGALASLEVIDLSKCGISGGIPSEIGSLQSLTNLVLFGNELTGKRLCSMFFLLGGYAFFACCPDFLCLSLPHLVFSQLPLGVLPSEVGLLSKLEVLHVEMNGLDGPLPTTIGDLGNLKVRLHTCIWLIGAVTLIFYILSCSCSSLCDCVEQALILSKNFFTGNLPAELGNLVNLEVLHLQDNLLEGKVPSELGKLISIEYLDLTNNIVSGEVPDGLCIDGAIIQVNCSVTCPVECCTNYEC